jgi:subtilisin-like proprotein convertase family protein
MQPKFTQRNLLLFFLRNALFLLLLIIASGQTSIAQKTFQKTTPEELKRQKENWIKNPESRNSLGKAPGYAPATNRFTPAGTITDAGNIASRAFCYNGSFQLNKQSVLNTTLTPIGAPVTFGFPGAEAWVTSIQQLYVVDQAAPFALYIVDTLSGARTFIANCTGVPQANLTGMTWDATTNTMYGVSSSLTASQIFRINISTGVCTPIGSPTTVAPGCIQINAALDGSLYSVDIVNDALYVWNKTTGVPTLVGSLGVDANFGQDGHFDLSDGQYYWAAFNNTSGQPELRIIDVLTGSSTLVGTYASQVATFGIYTPPTNACSGTPTPGNTQTSANPVCAGANFLLSTQIASAAGQTYQWQSGPSATGPWTDLGTGQSQITSQTVATFYRCVVTCGANSGTSTPLQVTMNAVTNCYCSAGATSTSFEKISRVQFGTINNPSTSTAGYENFTAVSTTLVKGQTAPITITLSQGFSSDESRAWIDFNQDGDFDDAGEAVFVSTQSAGPHTGTITISPTALTGPTRMRIRMQDADPFSAPNNSTPCGTSLFGQVEDYTINIQPCVQGAITNNPPARSIQCSGSTTIPVVATGSALTYQWQYRVSATSPWLAVTNVAPFSNITSASLGLSNVPASFNGYEFRALVTGPCTATIFSSGGVLTVTPLVATVTPTAASICIGSIQKISLTNATSPVTAVFAGGAGLPLIVTDNNLTGVSNTAVASGIPSNAVVTDVSVNFTMTHTWVGDVVMNLTAPNGQTINLIAALNAGAGNNSSDNFTNTVVSSTGVTALSGAPAPRTGTFKADLFTATIPSIAPTTGNTWAPLLTTLNGNWRLSMCDIAGGDEGTLQSWSINITYGAPATGIWTASPAAPNTMFTDAAATIPYVPGAQASDIWVNPTVNTSYSVVYATPPPSSCTSAPTVVPVTVVNAPTAVVNPTNKAVCVGGTTTFTTSATGGPFTYQWQVSTTAAPTFTNISGATAATLTLTGVTQTMNNNQYRAIISALPCVPTATTTAATLTVNPLPVITIASPVTQLVPGRSTTITATSTPGPLTAASFSWTKNGTAVAGATASTLPVDIDKIGTYRATVTDINGCVASSNNLVIGTESSDRLWLYPNPTDGAFQVRLYFPNFNVSERREVSVWNANGQMVARKSLDFVRGMSPYSQVNFDLSGMAPGTYLVKVTDKSTSRITSGLLVIQ